MSKMTNGVCEVYPRDARTQDAASESAGNERLPRANCPGQARRPSGNDSQSLGYAWVLGLMRLRTSDKLGSPSNLM